MRLPGIISMAALVLITALGSGCTKNKNGTVTLQIKARYKGEEMVYNHNYTGNGDTLLNFNTLHFYLSHINLVKNDNSLMEVKDVAFVDYGDPTSLSMDFKDIKGDFKAVRFGCGVDSAQNAILPDPQNPIGGPLYNGSDYWDMFRFHQFQVLNGKWGVPTDPYLNNPILYHTGTDALYKQSEVSKSFSVCCDKTTTLTLYLDLDKVFSGHGGTLQFPADEYTQCEGAAELAVAAKFTDNFSHAFTF